MSSYSSFRAPRSKKVNLEKARISLSRWCAIASESFARALLDFGRAETIRSLIFKCVWFRRLEGKELDSDVATLPADRVKEASVYEIFGIVLAVPLFLREG